ncbi:MAG: 16S rRNA (adenine(1518)-N(6)/adenine(1519)-N(6))-dimethyltransferase RsmA [Candidatus Saccharimonadales bacterium]
MNPPKKSLGQHWLFDDAALDAVVAAGEVTAQDTVLEIGPGLGTLTAKLVSQAAGVVAVETDRELAAGLAARVPATNLEVVRADILQFDLTQLPTGYKAVANIPYYLTSKILQYLIEADNSPTLLALLMQKEVAERVTASPGAMSVLAFSVQYYGVATIMGEIPKELFEPVPKVDSAILQVKPYPEPYFPAERKILFRLVKAGFGERRKKLINSLAGGLQISKAASLELVESAGLPVTVRAQELSLGDWGRLYHSYITYLR